MQSISDSTKDNFNGMLGNQQIQGGLKKNVNENVNFILRKYGEEEISLDSDKERAVARIIRIHELKKAFIWC